MKQDAPQATMTARDAARATMTARDAARLFGVSEATIYRFARIGEIPCLRFGRRVLFARHAIERLLERGTLGG